MIARVLGLLALLVLTACGGAEPKWATDEQVQAARHVAGGPPSVTLYTVLSTANDSGAHSSLLINGSERVIFDPAGTWYHPAVPERNDLHYGMNDRMLAFYIDYHARVTYKVVEQRLEVTPEIAELIKQRAREYGAVPKAQCANSVSTILRGVPGFESIPSTWFPKKLSAAFGEIPGVQSRLITDKDDDENHGVLMRQVSDGSINND